MSVEDPGRLRDLCVAEYPRLVGALRLVCDRDTELAEEFAQEAIARLRRDWHHVAEGRSPQAWLYRVGFNLANSHWRRIAVRRRLASRLVETSSVGDHADAAAERIDVRRALARLTDRERRVVVLRYFADLSVDETAQVLGASEQATRSLNHRALRKLRVAVSTDVTVAEG